MTVADEFREVVARLRGWGFDVREEPGCYSRSNGGGWAAGRPVGHVNHHYVCGMQSSQEVIDGLVQSLVNGNTVQWFADVNGRCYLIGVGPMNHAGTGNQSVLDATRADRAPASFPAAEAGTISGNPHYSGCECQHPGDDTPWPAAMLDVMVAINAAEALQWGWSANRAIEHGEWSSRKIDMSAGGGVNSDGWAAAELRRRVAARMTGATPAPEPEPPEDDMPRRIVTVVLDDENSALALDGPTGVVPLADPTELACVQAVIDDNGVCNIVEMNVYNAVLARGAGQATS